MTRKVEQKKYLVDCPYRDCNGKEAPECKVFKSIDKAVLNLGLPHGLAKLFECQLKHGYSPKEEVQYIGSE